VRHVAACLLHHGGRVLVVRRDGTWSVPTAARTAARGAARAATAGEPTLARTGEAVTVDGVTVHPFLFDVETREPGPAVVDADRDWLHPPALRDRPTPPWLPAAADRVAPDLATVRDDGDHGSAWVATRALAVLRDRAATAGALDDVVAVARALRDARPAMAAVANRVNRAMAGAGSPAAVRAAAERVLDASARADREAARAAAALVDGPVATLSRSGTVLAALRATDVPVVVGESRLGGEGATTAAALGDRATLVPDPVLPGTLAGLAGRPEAESVLVGTDAVLPDGSVLNRTGSYPLALAAREAGAPVRVVAARDKVRAEPGPPPDETEPPAGFGGDAATATPLFEVVPPRLVDRVVTEDGALDADAVARVAAEHREAARWDAGGG
jgi:translation initiation factor 2B subunit (eIF-2B alpha/beta/delta family)